MTTVQRQRGSSEWVGIQAQVILGGDAFPDNWLRKTGL